MTEARDTQPEPSEAAPAEAPSVRPLRRHRGTRSLVWMALEVALIAVGVFLGLAGEQWREDRANRRQAVESLRRFRAEIVANRDTVVSVKDYHAAKLKELNEFFAADAEARKSLGVRFEGLKPPIFEHTAWDLALATQSLAYIDPELAFALSRTYGYQAMTTDLGRGVMQAMYLRPPSEADSTFGAVVQLYYGDLIALEPGLLAAYDELLKAIDRALEE